MMLEKQTYQDAVKLVILLQASLEVMDDLKRTQLYKHDIKRGMNNLNTKVERHIKNQLTAIDSDEQNSLLFDEMKTRVEMITTTPLDALMVVTNELLKNGEDATVQAQDNGQG